MIPAFTYSLASHPTQVSGWPGTVAALTGAAESLNEMSIGRQVSIWPGQEPKSSRAQANICQQRQKGSVRAGGEDIRKEPRHFHYCFFLNLGQSVCMTD
jgi:hypothetical protein